MASHTTCLVALCAIYLAPCRGGAANSATGSRFSGDRVRVYGGPRGAPMGPAAALPSRGGNCDRWGVVTTIYAPSRAISSASRASGWCLVIVGDEKTPAGFVAAAWAIIANTMPLAPFVSV